MCHSKVFRRLLFWDKLALAWTFTGVPLWDAQLQKDRESVVGWLSEIEQSLGSAASDCDLRGLELDHGSVSDCSAQLHQAFQFGLSPAISSGGMILLPLPTASAV